MKVSAMPKGIWGGGRCAQWDTERVRDFDY